MQAFRVTKPKEYNIVDVHMPEIKNDEVMVRVEAAGICHTDIQRAAGLVEGFTSYPVILGHEFSGIVESVGKDVDRSRIGERVVVESLIGCGACNPCRVGFHYKCRHLDEFGANIAGGFSQYAAVPEKCLHSVNNATLDEASFCEPAANALSAVESANVQPGDSVAVIGPGPIGLLAVQMLKLKQAGKIIIVGTDRVERLKLAMELGADHAVNVTTGNPASEIMKITNNKGVDRVIQCASTIDAFRLSLEIAGRFSVIALEGVIDNNQSIEIAPNMFIDKSLSIVGVTGYNSRQFSEALYYIDGRKINVRPLISHVFPLNKVREAFQMIMEKQNGIMKIILRPNDRF